MKWTIEEQIKDTQVGKPHLVILGAGASVAAFPNGDKSGKKLPTMENFVETVGLLPTLTRHGFGNSKKNFELLYSQLCANADNENAKVEIEQRITNYFSTLELPDFPTMYDHLILSLRAKDVIATFNWDPFLWQACSRNHSVTELPETIFLHGSVAVGVDLKNKTHGPAGTRSKLTGRIFEPMPILYPITQKNYSSNPFIRSEWTRLKSALQDAFALTLFGYGAPDSDVEAVSLMKNAWGRVEERRFEEIEIIDIKPEADLLVTWSSFIHSHHYRIATNFYDSIIGHHPRRSCEALWNQLFECKFPIHNSIPRTATYQEWLDWLKPFLNAEN